MSDTRNPSAISGSFDPLVSGQFVNPHGSPSKVRKTGYLGVEKPTRRGKRVVGKVIEGDKPV